MIVIEAELLQNFCGLSQLMKLTIDVLSIYKVIKIIKEIIQLKSLQKSFLQCSQFHLLLTIYDPSRLCTLILLSRAHSGRIIPTTGVREQSQLPLLLPRSRYLLPLQSKDFLFFPGRT